MNMMQYEEDLSKFREQLAPFGLKVKEMGADGNCFFRAIADQLEGDESSHMTYRYAAVDYMRLNKEMYTPFIEDDETIDQYCDDMAKDGVWGDQLEMNALASSYKFNMVVHQVDHPSMVQCFHPPMGSVPTLHLSYHLNEHYNSVRRGDDVGTRGICPLKEYPIGHDLEKVKQTMKGVEVKEEEK
jgi:OTU domain-containing protein 3